MVESLRVCQQNLNDLLDGRLVLRPASAEECVRLCTEVNEGEKLRMEVLAALALEVTVLRGEHLDFLLLGG